MKTIMTMRRDNNGKPRLSLIPWLATQSVADILHWACTEKECPYPRDNWRKGGPVTDGVDSAMRHLVQFSLGIDNDTDSNLPHLAHAACQILMLLENIITGVAEDDRP